MRTFQIPKPCETAQLHEELLASGVPVITVRGSHAKEGEPAMCAVVVTHDAADPSKIAAVIAAHLPKSAPSKTPTANEMSMALANMEKV
jgi:hypothetical protein